jgi:hypothetical protein
VGCDVEFEQHMLEATLGPGILSRNYDGLQNNLETMDGVFLQRGQYTAPLDNQRQFRFTPTAKVGDKVQAADWLGEVPEGWLAHKIMVPFALEGTYTLKWLAASGDYTIEEKIAVLTDENGTEHPVTMVQKWPVKKAITAYKDAQVRGDRAAADRGRRFRHHLRQGFRGGGDGRRRDRRYFHRVPAGRGKQNGTRRRIGREGKAPDIGRRQLCLREGAFGRGGNARDRV